MKNLINLIIIGIIVTSCSFQTPSTNTTSIYVVPHPDDWQLFMNPNASYSIKNPDEKVIFFHITSGDAGKGTGYNKYYLAREKGSLRALRFVSNTFTSGARLGPNMHEKVVKFDGHRIKKYTYRNIVAYFLRLPDGNVDGSGFSKFDFVSLQKFYEGTATSLPAIDNRTKYTSPEDLKETLKSMIQFECADSEIVKFNLPDENTATHPDHIYSSKIFQEVAGTLDNSSITLNLYRDYDTDTMPQNVFGYDLLISAATWGVTTSELSDNFHYSTWDSLHNSWIGKQYFKTLTLSQKNSSPTDSSGFTVN